jgi:hypothetical protein
MNDFFFQNRNSVNRESDKHIQDHSHIGINIMNDTNINYKENFIHYPKSNITQGSKDDLNSSPLFTRQLQNKTSQEQTLSNNQDGNQIKSYATIKEASASYSSNYIYSSKCNFALEEKATNTDELTSSKIDELLYINDQFIKSKEEFLFQCLKNQPDILLRMFPELFQKQVPEQKSNLNLINIKRKREINIKNSQKHIPKKKHEHNIHLKKKPEKLEKHENYPTKNEEQSLASSESFSSKKRKSSQLEGSKELDTAKILLKNKNDEDKDKEKEKEKKLAQKNSKESSSLNETNINNNIPQAQAQTQGQGQGQEIQKPKTKEEIRLEKLQKKALKKSQNLMKKQEQKQKFEEKQKLNFKKTEQKKSFQKSSRSSRSSHSDIGRDKLSENLNNICQVFNITNEPETEINSAAVNSNGNKIKFNDEEEDEDEVEDVIKLKGFTLPSFDKTDYNVGIQSCLKLSNPFVSNTTNDFQNGSFHIRLNDSSVKTNSNQDYKSAKTEPFSIFKKEFISGRPKLSEKEAEEVIIILN